MPFEKNEFMPAARILKKLEQVDPQAIYTPDDKIGHHDRPPPR